MTGDIRTHFIKSTKFQYSIMALSAILISTTIAYQTPVSYAELDIFRLDVDSLFSKYYDDLITQQEFEQKLVEFEWSEIDIRRAVQSKEKWIDPDSYVLSYERLNKMNKQTPTYSNNVVQISSVFLNPNKIFTINAGPSDLLTLSIKGFAPRTAMEPVLIKITSPNGNIVAIDQVTVDTNGNYFTEIKMSKNLWKENGAYVITAFQGPSENNNFVKTNVEVVNGFIARFNLNYQIDGAFIKYIDSEPESKSLIISIDTEVYDQNMEILSDGTMRNGFLIIELPRNIFDAKIYQTSIDDEFIVLVDGIATPYEEAVSSSIRTLTISFPYGSEEITIIGTNLNSNYIVNTVSESTIHSISADSNNESGLKALSSEQSANKLAASSTLFVTAFGAIAAVTAGLISIAFFRGIF